MSFKNGRTPFDALQVTLAPQQDGARKAIMVAEDDPIVALDLEQQIASEGYEVCGPFRHAGTAIDALVTKRPDLAIIDYNLIDGVADELMGALTLAQVPFIIVTVASPVELPENIKPLWVFSKPFDIGNLSSLVGAAVAIAPAQSGDATLH